MTTTKNGRQLVTKAEAARQLGVSTRTVERRLAAGELTVADRIRESGRGGRLVMIDLDQVIRHAHGVDAGQMELDLT